MHKNMVKGIVQHFEKYSYKFSCHIFYWYIDITLMSVYSIWSWDQETFSLALLKDLKLGETASLALKQRLKSLPSCTSKA